MKTIYNFCTLMMMLLLVTSCATKATFPVSDLVPAADISAKKKTDSNKNITLEITCKNLASPDRLNPSGNNYNVWVVTKEYGIKNVGQLIVDNAKKSSFKTVTPFDFDEVFITVEDQGDLKYPTGREISRVKI
ncbi:MAG: hypothetical protein IE891_11510 [Flavobacteriaceae bacterium]|nr:hypothetical protein [Flavobacteriaceae bacterium]